MILQEDEYIIENIIRKTSSVDYDLDTFSEWVDGRQEIIETVQSILSEKFNDEQLTAFFQDHKDLYLDAIPENGHYSVLDFYIDARQPDTLVYKKYNTQASVSDPVSVINPLNSFQTNKGTLYFPDNNAATEFLSLFRLEIDSKYKFKEEE